MVEPDNKIGDPGARSLAEAIKGLKGLEVLYLHSEYVLGCWPSPTVVNETHTHHPDCNLHHRYTIELFVFVHQTGNKLTDACKAEIKDTLSFIRSLLV